MKSNLKRHFGIVAATLFLAGNCLAADLLGKVTNAVGQDTTIKLDGELAPNVGDGATIYFKLPGTDEEVMVGMGKVTDIAADSVTVKIENARGQPQKGQLARISSQNPKPKAAAIPKPPAATPSQNVSAAAFRHGKLLEDPFETLDDPLQLPGNSNVNGEREIIAARGKQRSRPYTFKTYDFFVECYVRRGKNSDCRFGFYFRSGGGPRVDNCYALFIDPARRVLQLICVINGQWQTPQEHPLPDRLFVDPGEKTRIGVAGVGSLFHVFLNDKPTATFTNDALPGGGRIALIVYNGPSDECIVHFDDVQIYDLHL